MRLVNISERTTVDADRVVALIHELGKYSVQKCGCIHCTRIYLRLDNEIFDVLVEKPIEEVREKLMEDM